MQVAIYWRWKSGCIRCEVMLILVGGEQQILLLEREKIMKKVILDLIRAFASQKNVYLIGTPEHSNIGDSAIVLAEKKFLQACGVRKEAILEITVSEWLRYQKLFLKSIRPKELICFTGGGNMGDQWISEEQFRRQCIKGRKKNPVLIFPQTLFYTDTPKGRMEKRNSVFYYNRSSDLVITAREQKSYEDMKSLYPEAEILLTPDIVLFTDRQDYGITRHRREGILLCFRQDAERQMSDEKRSQIERYLKEKKYRWKRSDMHAKGSVTAEQRKESVHKKMSEFAQARLVITDRLHAMIFAALTETPCIVFENYNQKIAGTYEWIRHLPYIRLVGTTEEMCGCISELWNMQHCFFDNEWILKQYGPLKEAARRYVDQCDCTCV